MNTLSKPFSIILAVWVMYALLLISFFVDVIINLIETKTFDNIGTLIFIYSLLGVIPFFISEGGKLARTIYFVVVILAYIGAYRLYNYTDVAFYVYILLMPVNMFIIYNLYHVRSNKWFNLIEEMQLKNPSR